MKLISLRSCLILTAALVVLGLAVSRSAFRWWNTASQPVSIGVERSAQSLTPDPHLHSKLLRVLGPLGGEVVQPIVGLTTDQLWLVELQVRNSAARIDPPFTIDPSAWSISLRDRQGRVFEPFEPEAPIAGQEVKRSFSTGLSSGNSETAWFAFRLPSSTVPTEVWFSAEDALSRSIPWWESTPLHSKVVWTIAEPAKP